MPERIFDGNLNLYDGSIVSDNTLIRDSQYFANLHSSVDEELKGGEMEAAGFARACALERSNFPWLVVRSVSDFGDTIQNEVFQELAAKSACLALRILLSSCLDFGSLPDNPRANQEQESLQTDIVKQIRNAYKANRWAEVCNTTAIISRHLWVSGQYELRIELGKMSNEAARQIRDGKRHRMRTLIDDVGWTTFASGGSPAEAKSYIEDGMRIAKDKKDFYYIAKARRHLASIARREGDYERAGKQLSKAEKAAKRIESAELRIEMQASLRFSSAKLKVEDTSGSSMEAAIDAAREAAACFKGLGHDERAVKVYSFIGDQLAAQGKYSEAQEAYEEGLEESYGLSRYDEIRNNTIALISLPRIEPKRRYAYLNRIIQYCIEHDLESEQVVWQNTTQELESEP